MSDGNGQYCRLWRKRNYESEESKKVIGMGTHLRTKVKMKMKIRTLTGSKGGVNGRKW